MKLLTFLTLLPAALSATEWFKCDPTFFRKTTGDTTTQLTSPLSSHLRKLVSDYESQKYEELFQKRATTFETKCTILRVPLNHDRNDNQFIDMFVKCYSKSSSTTGQMWFIQGGPGASSIAMEGFLSEAMERVGDQYDACTFDFRGVFRSNGLYCQANQAETPGSDEGCAVSNKEAGDCRKGVEISYSLNDFDTTQAAKDIKTAIDAVGKPNVVLYGVSYGTYLLGRFTQIYPNVAKVLIFDSVANLAGDYLLTFDRWDEVNNNVMNELLKLCKSDSFCASKLSSDPKAFALKALDNVFGSANSCPELKKFFGTKESFIGTAQGIIQSLLLRPLFTTFLYRLNRCSANDVTFIKLLSGDGSSDDSSNYFCSEESSQVIYNNVGFAEMWDNTLSEQDIISRGKALDFNGGSSQFLFSHRASWSNTVRRDSYYNRTLSPSGKVLVLQSDLDPQTPLVSAQSFFRALNVSNNQAYLGIGKGGVHVTADSFTIESQEVVPCGMNVMFGFVKNPNVAPDFSCLSRLHTEEFEGPILAYLLGINDLYESKLSSASMILPGIITLFSIILVLF